MLNALDVAAAPIRLAAVLPLRLRGPSLLPCSLTPPPRCSLETLTLTPLSLPLVHKEAAEPLLLSLPHLSPLPRSLSAPSVRAHGRDLDAAAATPSSLRAAPDRSSRLTRSASPPFTSSPKELKRAAANRPRRPILLHLRPPPPSTIATDPDLPCSSRAHARVLGELAVLRDILSALLPPCLAVSV